MCIGSDFKRNFDTYIKMYEKARTLEKTDVDQAIEIYKEILRITKPEGTSYYERPAILLEKQKRFDEAIEVCNIAFENVKIFNKQTRECILLEMGKRRERLLKKSDNKA